LNEVFTALHHYRYSAQDPFPIDKIHDQLSVFAALVPLHDEKLLAFAKQKLILEQQQLEQHPVSPITKQKNLQLDILDHQLIARVDKELQLRYEQISDEIVDHLLARCVIDTTFQFDALLPEIMHLLSCNEALQ